MLSFPAILLERLVKDLHFFVPQESTTGLEV
jgi:hypothetical protein